MDVKPFVEWSPWQRAFMASAAAATGVYIGFASSGDNLSVNPRVYIAVFTIAFINLMLVVVSPRIHAQKIAGMPAPNPWGVTYRVLAERPFTTALVMLQLRGVSRASATTILMVHAAESDYVRSLPNAHSMTLRLISVSVIMASVAVLWLVGAIGLWRSRPWAWWLVLVLNGLDATVVAAGQLLRRNEFFLDLPAVAAVVLLLLRPVRMEFRGGQATIKQVAD